MELKKVENLRNNIGDCEPVMTSDVVEIVDNYKMTSERFKQLYSMDIVDMVEQIEISATRKLSYLSWANAVKIATEQDPNFTFEFVVNQETNGYMFPETVKKVMPITLKRTVETIEMIPVKVEQDGVEKTLYEPKKTKQMFDEEVLQEVIVKQTFFVKTRVTMFGMIKEMALPIMDNKNNSVTAPDSRDINDNLMRCLAKNIALFGIGLPLYAGEDIEKFKTKDEKQILKEKVMKKYNKDNPQIMDIFRNHSKLHNKMVKDFDVNELKELNEGLEKAGF